MSIDWEEKRFAASIRRQAEQDHRAGRPAFVRTAHSCVYDWAPEFAGQRLCCVADHHHADSTTTVIVWPLSATLRDMYKAGVLTGEALQDAQEAICGVGGGLGAENSADAGSRSATTTGSGGSA